MSKFSDLLDELERNSSTDADEDKGDWYDRQMANARAWDTELPEIDTRGVQPVKENSDEFSFFDALAAGTGRAMEHLGTGINEAFRPESMTPSEWKKHQSQLFREITESLQSTGSAMAERNHHQYEDNSVNYHLQNIVESLPESLAIMGGAYATGAPLGGLLGGAGKTLIRGAEMLPGGLRAVENLYRAYNAATPAAKVARFVAPSSARALASAELGAIPEAYIEQLEAEKRYVELAKQNGTYEPDKTEMDAKDPGKNVFLGNVGVISAFNIPEYGLMFGKGGGLKSKAGRALLASLLEGTEEVGQEIVSANALGEPVDKRAVRDAFIAGAGTGMGMHVVGQGTGYIGDRIAGRPTDEEIAKLQEEFKQFRKEQSGKESELYGKFREDTQKYLDQYEEAPRQSYREAETEAIHRSTATGYGMPENVFDLIVKTARELGVPPERALATALAESEGNQDVISEAGAIGVMQLMPETAEALGVDPYNLEQNIRGGIMYLKQMYDATGDWKLAHAAYNAGPNAVKRYGGVPPFKETKGYVDNINYYLAQLPSADEGSILNSDNGYYGEGGKGEGKYWEFNPSMNASVEGISSKFLSALDMLGKWYYDRTGKKLWLNSGTDGNHADGDYSHKKGYKVDVVDEYVAGEDSPLITADFQKGKLADEFIAYGRSLGLGMNFEAAGEQRVHFDISFAGEQWDGNGENAGGFNPRKGRDIQSRADEIYAGKKRNLDANKPNWSDYYVKTTPKPKESTPEPEPEKPRQISLDDAIFSDFAKDRFAKAVEDKDVDTIKFFEGMFEGDNTFIDTRKNRALIQRRYGDEVTQFAETRANTAETAQPAQSQNTQANPQPKQSQPATPAQKPQSSQYLRNDPVIQAGNKFIEELAASGKAEDFAKSLEVYSAIQQGDVAEIKNLLKQNGREGLIQQVQQESQSQPQEDPVKQNTTPENKLAQSQPTQETPQPQEQGEQVEQKRPRQKLTPRQQAENTLQKPAKSSTKVKKRRGYGDSILLIADQEGIEIPEADRQSLHNGKTTVLNKWRDLLFSKGVVQIQEPAKGKQSQTTKPAEQQPAQQNQTQTTQETQQQPSLIERARAIVQEATDAARQNWNDIKQDYRERGARARMPQSQSIDRAVASRPSAKRFSQRAEINQEVYDPTVANTAERERIDNIPSWRGRTREENIARRRNLREEIDDSIQRRRQRRATNLINSLPDQDLEATVGTQDIQNTEETVGNVKQKLRETETQAKNQEAYRRAEQQARQRRLDSYMQDESRTEVGSVRGNRDIQNTEDVIDLNQTRKEIQAREEQNRRAREERQQRLDSYSRDDSTVEIGAVRGKNNPESEPYHVQTREEIQAEQKARNAERTRQRQANDSYAHDDAGEVQPAQVSYGNRDSDGNPEDTIDVRQILKTVQSGKMQGTPKVAPKETTQSQNKVYGNSAEVVSDKQSPYQTKYRVVEADELNASHTMDGDNVFTNESYPKELQPRDRNRVEMSAQTVRMANSLSPADLMESRNANQGAPVIRSDGVVLNGNGRTMAIRRAYETGKGEGHKDAIVQNAEKLGLDADKVSKMRRPVLVREVAQDISDEDVRNLTSSTTGGARLGASEQAKIDAQKLSKEALDLSPEDEITDLTQAKSQDFVRAVIGDITANADERNSLVDAKGNIAQDGINRVKRALFARAYGDDGLISRMSESIDDNIRGVSNALLTAAPEIAKVQKSMEAGALHDYDLSAIPAAAKKLSSLRNEGKTVATFLKEQSLFGEETATPEAKEILRFFDRKKFAPNKIAQFLREIAKGIRNQGNPNQGSLFGAREPKPLLDIIKRAADNVENGGQADMFAEAERANETKGEEQNEAGKTEKTETKASKPAEKNTDKDAESGQAQEKVTPAEAAKRYNESNSIEGGADTRIINFVDDAKLTPRQKLLKDFAAKLGVPIQFFDNPDGRFHGAFADGITFLNVNSKKGLGGVFWHESFHWLKANNPKLYAKLVDAAGITQAQRDAFLKRTGRKDLTTNEEIDEEILADQMEDVAKRTGLLQSIAGKNRGLIERVVQWLKDTMNKFIDTFRNPTGRLTTAQAKALAGEFGKIARSLKDADGNHIFRVNNRTGDIEVIGGRKAPDVSHGQGQTATQSLAIKYSIAPADNSNESWGRRITNFAKAIFGNKPPTKPHQQIITDALSKLARHKIYYGYNGKKDGDVVVDSHQKAIFARHGYDFEKLLPVVGKQIAANLKLPDTPEMSNYIAKWMATGAINDTSAEANAFKKAMLDNPAEAELLQSVRDSFEALAKMTPYEKFRNSIVHGGKKQSDSGGFMENFVDDLYPIKRLEDLLVDKAEDPKIAALIRDNLAPYLNSRLFKGKGAISDMMIGERGHKYTDEDIKALRDVLQAQYPNVDFSNFKPLAAIIQEAGGDLEGLEVFALAKLNKEMYEKLREVDDKGNPKHAPGSLTPSQSEADCDAVIKAGEKKFGKAQEALVDYANTMAAIQYTSGLISATKFYSMVGGWKNYIPTARVFDEDEPYSVDITAADSLKQKTGSKRRIISPLEKLAANTEIFLRQAERNKVKLNVAQMVRFGGFGDVIAETPKGDNRDNTVHFRENGQMKYLVTPDKSIVRALESIQTPADSNIILQGLKTAGVIMRGMYTMWNAEFAVGNPFRDMPDAFIHNKYGSRNPLIVIPAMVRASIDGLAQSVGLKAQTKDFREFLAYGGTQSGFSYELTEGASNRVEDITAGTRTEEWKKGFKPFWKQMWRDFIKVMEASENMTRYATYKTALDGLVEKHGGNATVQDKKLAALQARSASVDFARAGKSMRSVNKYLLFSNAAVQSLALWGEKFAPSRLKTKEGRAEAFTALWKAFLGGVVTAAAFSALNYSDDDRRKRYGQLQNWEKDNYWVFATDIGGQSIRIPKGMDVILRATSALTEEYAAYLAENKPADWSRITTLLRNGLPSLTTTIFTPMIETMTNYSLFKDAPIVPYGQQDEPAYKQYGKNTSWLAKELGELINYSPRKIDHWIQGYGGSQATWLTGGGDGLPVLRRFLFDPDKNPRIVQDYYKALREQEDMLKTYKTKRQDGENVDLPEEYDRALHARLKAAQEPMRKISRMEMQIVDSDKLSDDQKKERLRKLEENRVALCERVFRKAR